MNRVAWSKVVCWAVILCFFAMGCGTGVVDEATVLRGRAEGLGNLLLRIQDMPEAEAKQALNGFIEPSPTRADRIAVYYSEFSATSKKFRIVSQSISKISINSDGVSADVTYLTTAKIPGGRKIPVEQVTQWKHVDGKWYRTIGDPKKKVR